MRVVGYLLAVLLGVSAVGLTLRAVNSPVATEGLSQDKSEPSAEDMIIEGVRFIQTVEGRKKLEIISDETRLNRAEHRARFDNVEVIFFLSEGKTIRLRADTGVLDTESNKMKIAGNVEGVSSDGFDFQTSAMDYDSQKKVLWTKKPVVLNTRNGRMQGDGMQIDLKAESLSFQGKVKMVEIR